MPPDARTRMLVALLVGMASIGRADEPARPVTPTNRLARETSPYLRLHAHNPVDWYPWGPEAFARAKAENKPIFLSVGYSSCYWCHVMERESFMDPAIARLLNANFICIKVDREERPDVDALYMAALQTVSGSGGWPMSMFLLPDGRPFFGGTYFPPHERDDSAGFDDLIAAVSTAWRDKRGRLEADAARLTEAVKKAVDRSSDLGRVPLSRELAANGVKELAEQFDPEFGGFGFSAVSPNRPKFPEPANLVFLLDRDRRLKPGGTPSEPRAQVLTTLDRMAQGGIRDQLAGGYHRYSTRRDWSIPHFEKMLYDNAQLASVHLLAFERTGDPRWRSEAEATFAFVARSMTGPEGGFFSSLDAESEGEEGRSYVWTADEVARALGPEGIKPFALAYGLDRPPNFDKGRHVLLEPEPPAAVAARLGLAPEAMERKLAPLRRALLEVRDRRPQPALDDKVITAWNGLMIAAYADGFRVLKNPAYRRAAERAADFLLAKLRDADGRLLRTYREGRAKLPAYLEDYAFLAHGLLRLHAATGDPVRLAQARNLADRMIADFDDREHGGFFFTATDHESLLARAKDPFDGAVPGGNSVAIRVLVALARATGEPRYRDRAGRALDGFSASLARRPAGSPLMLVALDEYLDLPGNASPPAVASPAPSPRKPGVVNGSAPVVAVAPGQPFEVPLTLSIAPGFHVYANDPGREEMVPTAVTLSKSEGFTLIDVSYPKGTPQALDANGPGQVNLYEGSVTIKVRLGAASALAPGRAGIKLLVKYQACNDRSCLAPTTLEVPVTLEVRDRP